MAKNKVSRNRLEISTKERFEGAFFGFAVGDAFGHPARDMTFDEMCNRFEKSGCLEMSVNRAAKAALFTDATQLMLFTSDGIVWADEAARTGQGVNYTNYVFLSYQYWLYTQIKKLAHPKYENLFNNIEGIRISRFIKVKPLYKNRRRDDTLVNAFLKMPYMGYGKISSKNKPAADKPEQSRDQGNFSDAAGLMRVLPAGLYFSYDIKTAFRVGCDFAAVTHTVPDGYLPAGVFSAVIAGIISGMNLGEAITEALEILETYDGNGRTFEAVRQAVYLADESDMKPLDAMKELYQDESACEVLSCALYAALIHGYTNFKNSIRLAANYDGPSEITAALTGAIVGTIHGIKSIPPSWKSKLQMRSLLEDEALELYSVSAAAEEAESEEDE